MLRVTAPKPPFIASFARALLRKGCERLLCADSEWETAMAAPRGSRELRRSLSHTARTYSSAAPLPSSQQFCNSGQAPDLQGCSTSKSQAYDHKPAANVLTGCHAFKSNDSLPGCPLKAPPRLPIMRTWAVHSAYRSEFAQEIEAQQTPRHRSNAPLTPRPGFGIASTPRPILTKAAVLRQSPQQVCSDLCPLFGSLLCAVLCSQARMPELPDY